MYWAFTAIPAFLALYLLPPGSREMIRYVIPALVLLEVGYANQVAAEMRALRRSTGSGPVRSERLNLVPYAMGVFLYIFIGMELIPASRVVMVGSIGTTLILVSKFLIGRSRISPSLG